MDQVSTEEMEGISICYVIINNIPKSYHSSDLRNFFSEFVETSGFSCFHFRHRPEVQKSSKISDHRRVTSCCVAKVLSDRVDEFILKYNNKHWIDRKGHSLTGRCFIRKINLTDEGESSNESISTEGDVLSSKDVSTMIEMHPPVLMPNGNVGTPTKYFLDQIRLCRLPPSIISKLGLEFPHSRAKRLYSSVNYDYGGRRSKGKVLLDDGIVKTSKGDIISENYVEGGQMSHDETKPRDDGEAEEEEEEEEEEWDRHESLHDDVTQQDRLKERLFEEKIELKWEKGGSGLVFYTDAQYWDQKEGDFDAKTADDWDIDMTGYYEPGQGDKDSRDFLKMRLEKRLREGMCSEKVDVNDFAGFEKYSKGFGRRLLESQGWKEGDGLGGCVVGMAEPILDIGQHPRDKKGFGYRGEKLTRVHPSKKRRKRLPAGDDDVDRIRISTVYDDPMKNDSCEPLLRSNFLTQLKYRKEFLRGESTSDVN